MKIILILHILFGTLALISGLAALFTKKGSQNHIRAGKVFALSMAIVAAAALILHLPRGLYFLPAIGVFSYYLAYSGVRMFKVKRNGFNKIDLTMALFCAAAGVALIAISVYIILMASNSMVLVTLGFGFGCLALSISDVVKITRKIIPIDARIAHLQRMGGAFIATVTAVLVVNAGNIDWVNQHPAAWPVLWFLPSVVGSLLITRSIVKIKSAHGNR